MRMLRAALTAGFLLASSFATSGVALAGRDWCEDDPVFHVNGSSEHVVAAWDLDSATGVTSLTYVLAVPRNVSAWWTLPSSTRVPTSVAIDRSLPAWHEHDALKVVLHATARSSVSGTVIVQVNGAFGQASATGTTNSTIDLPLSLSTTHSSGDRRHGSRPPQHHPDRDDD